MTNRELLAAIMAIIPSTFENLLESLDDASRNLEKGVDSPLFSQPFRWLGWLIRDLEQLNENNYDVAEYSRMREKATEAVRAFCDKWGAKYFEKAKSNLSDAANGYRELVIELEDRIKEGTLVEDCFEENYDRYFVIRDIIADIFSGIRVASYSKELDLQSFEAAVGETDKQFRKLIPVFAETYAVVPKAFEWVPTTDPKSWWWEHEAYRLHQMYRAKLPPGTPDKGIRDNIG